MSKKRNTYLLHKVLIEEMTKRMVSDSGHEVIEELYRECFKKDTELSKELSILKEYYKYIADTPEESFKFLIELKKEHSKLDSDKIYKEQTEAIKKINKVDQSIFNNFLKEYRVINNLNNFLNDKLKISEKLKIENMLMEGLLEGKKKKSLEKIESLAAKKKEEDFVKKFGELDESISWIVSELIKCQTLAETYNFFGELSEKTIQIIENKKEQQTGESKDVLLETLDFIKKNNQYSDENLQKIISIYENCVSL